MNGYGRVLVALSALPLMVFGTAAHAAVPKNATTNYCPFTFGNDPTGVDADYVTFLGPDTIDAMGVTNVSVGVSEEEAAANPVSITVVATASDGAAPVEARADGTHDVVVDVPLPGATYRTWTLNWVATFDFGVHPCASAVPNYHAFTVTST